MRACIRHVRDEGAGHIVVGILVGPPDTIHELEELADEVVCLKAPSNFMAVG
ncbi:hypothetical protein GJR96_16665 [Haloferax sp. MBLA0076]|uniref:Uncharacterized protein n=1 Tax=Haloferax litoreum TaxID=2666140 RepID=A0A6A8GJX1_9EURY|nr:hypothetical protein Hfx1148_16610 [Haloferax sp. CBA1148]MRX23578.1 hypothetical protein [Haloferax litoreum]